jgi:hypothetical protein
MGFVNLLKALPLFSLFFLMACGGKLPGFRVQEKSDSFQQASATSSDVDLLFVMDNSGSMQDEQDGLADNFETFITEFASRSLDFHIGIISTDNRTTASVWSRTTVGGSYYGIYNDGVGSLLSKYSSYRYLSSATPDFVTKFQNNIRIGITGSGYEMPISTAIKSIEISDSSSEWNYGFFRSSAFLAVIMVTDEDEAVSNSDDRSVSINTTTMNSRISQLKSSLDTLKGDASKYAVYAIAAPSLAECTTAYKEGTAVIAAANAMGGEVANICSSFATTLNTIGSKILSMATRFKLVQPPEGDIEVYVNGASYPKDTTHTNGWDYISSSQEIEFYGTYVPDAGSSIKVVYVPSRPTT